MLLDLGCARARARVCVCVCACIYIYIYIYIYFFLRMLAVTLVSDLFSSGDSNAKLNMIFVWFVWLFIYRFVLGYLHVACFFFNLESALTLQKCSINSLLLSSPA